MTSTTRRSSRRRRSELVRGGLDGAIVVATTYAGNFDNESIVMAATQQVVSDGLNNEAIDMTYVRPTSVDGEQVSPYKHAKVNISQD